MRPHPSISWVLKTISSLLYLQWMWKIKTGDMHLSEECCREAAGRCFWGSSKNLWCDKMIGTPLERSDIYRRTPKYNHKLRHPLIVEEFSDLFCRILHSTKCKRPKLCSSNNTSVSFRSSSAPRLRLHFSVWPNNGSHLRLSWTHTSPPSLFSGLCGAVGGGSAGTASALINGLSVGQWSAKLSLC